MHIATLVDLIFEMFFNPDSIYLYVMLNMVVTGLFLVSAAIAAGSFTLVSQLRNKYKLELFSTLLYMQVFYFMFGFYAVWGQVIIFSYLSPLIETNILDRITEISVLLGSPFIVFGWLMFLKFVMELVGIKSGRIFDILFLVVNIFILVIIGLWNYKVISLHTLETLKYFFLVSNLIYALLAGMLLIFKKGSLLPVAIKQKNFLVTGIIFFSVSQSAFLLFYEDNIMILLLFIFLFFAGTAFIPVFIKVNIEVLEKGQTLPVEIFSFENFCKKHEISPRERDIILEICNGLTNQQIADKLFISLQTVKDHTHRIYNKTMASSRMQLMKMVQQLSNDK